MWGPSTHDDDIMSSALQNSTMCIYIYRERDISIYIYIVFHALCMIMCFGRSKCEASEGHGVILYQSGCSKGFQQRCCFQNRSGGQ